MLKQYSYNQLYYQRKSKHIRGKTEWATQKDLHNGLLLWLGIQGCLHRYLSENI